MRRRRWAIGENETAVAGVGCVLAVDDHAPFRAALRRLIETTATLAVVGEADSGEAAVALVVELEPDLVIMDVEMPGVDGVAASTQIKRTRPETVVCLVSATRPEELRRDAARCPADAIVWKGDLTPRLLEAIWARHAA